MLPLTQKIQGQNVRERLFRLKMIWMIRFFKASLKSRNCQKTPVSSVPSPSMKRKDIIINVIPPNFYTLLRLPARYFDPVTQQPYYSIQAFKILREAYYMQLEERGNTDNPQLQKWLEWRKLVKENRLKSVANTS